METTDSTCLFYKDIIGVHTPWMVTAVTMDDVSRKVTIRIEHDPDKTLACPICAHSTMRYDHRVRVLRYLDTCQYETFLEVYVPRVKCPKDGVQQIPIPYAEKHSRFTSRFEMAIIIWLQSTPISTVADNFNLSPNFSGFYVIGKIFKDCNRSLVLLVVSASYHRLLILTFLISDKNKRKSIGEYFLFCVISCKK